MTVESAQHLELDELAAFVDGRLTADRRQQTIKHLSGCADCRDLFAETARLVAEMDFDKARQSTADRRVLPGPWRRRIAFGAAVAAGLTLLLLSPRLLELAVAPSNSLAAVTVELVPTEAAPDRDLSAALSKSWLDHEWPRPRSLGPTSALTHEERSFQLGVRVFELEIALRSGHDQLAQRLTYRLENLLPEGLDNELLYLYASDQGIRGRLEAGADPRTLTDLNATAAELLSTNLQSSDDGVTDRFWFELGLWSRAAQLAAEAGQHEFFAQRSNRRRLQEFAERPLPALVAASVGRLIQLSEEPAVTLAEIERQMDKLVTIAGGGTPAEGT